MNMYFFSNKSYGSCYTVMADTLEEAREIVKQYIQGDNKKHENPITTKELKKEWQAEEDRTVGEFSFGGNYFIIRMYGPYGVIETDYD